MFQTTNQLSMNYPYCALYSNLKFDRAVYAMLWILTRTLNESSWASDFRMSEHVVHWYTQKHMLNGDK
jgi:hypothetical protein